ncbi:hypothetical protein [Corynebacterium mustelae]|uniref:hypothetical protein n=1 Tax=Corynebacterium mustelae TaxID=571915 RepID=UPI000640DB0E|nr:hypothetical protein [Corynebacterium mustelae]
MSEADVCAENDRLRRELAEARLDNEFLSKVTTFFAAKQRERKSSNNAAGEGELQHHTHDTTLRGSMIPER